MSLCNVAYSKEHDDYDIKNLPAICFEVIINALWNDKATRWLAAELSDEEAEALAACGMIPKEEE